MKSIGSLLSVCVLFLTISTTPATATPLLDIDSTGVIGILGLDIGGTQYDVHWPDGSFEDIFGTTTTPLFWGNEASSLEARSAISDTLNAFNVNLAKMGGGFSGLSDDNYAAIHVPFGYYDNDPYYINTHIARWLNSDLQWDASYEGTITTFRDLNYVYDTYAIFSPSSTSVPDASIAFLIGPSLILLGIIGRRKS